MRIPPPPPPTFRPRSLFQLPVFGSMARMARHGVDEMNCTTRGAADQHQHRAEVQFSLSMPCHAMPCHAMPRHGVITYV